MHMHYFNGVVFIKSDPQTPYGVEKACFTPTEHSSQSVDALPANNSHAFDSGYKYSAVAFISG